MPGGSRVVSLQRPRAVSQNPSGNSIGLKRWPGEPAWDSCVLAILSHSRSRVRAGTKGSWLSLSMLLIRVSKISILSSSKLPRSLSRGKDSMVGASGLESIGQGSTRLIGNDSPSLWAASVRESRIMRMYFERTNETYMTGMLN